MKTKDIIAQKALELFNQHGLNHVTLRDVAAALDKSYGNITYHFSTKEKVVMYLYSAMQKELVEIGHRISNETDFFRHIVLAPWFMYDLSIRYLFLFKDVLDIIRLFPELAKDIYKKNEQRKHFYVKGLRTLRDENIIRQAFTDEDIDALMDSSGAVRTMYFQFYQPGGDEKREREAYFIRINRVLKPYLSEQGLQRFTAILHERIAEPE